MSYIISIAPFIGLLYIVYGLVLLLVTLYFFFSFKGKEVVSHLYAKVVYKGARIAILIGHMCLGIYAMLDSKIMSGIAFICIGVIIFLIMQKAVPSIFKNKEST